MKIQNKEVYGKINQEEFAKLNTETLYVADFSLITAREKMNDQPDKFFTNYRYAYKIISAEKLNRKILNNEAFYYATLTRCVSYA